MNDEQPRVHLDAKRSVVARQVMDRAIRRLDILESLILVAAAVAAMVGGWLAAWLARGALGLPFRPTWVVASLVLFVVPGLLVWRRERKSADGSTRRRGDHGHANGLSED